MAAELYVDGDHFENAHAALRGAQALGIVIAAGTTGDSQDNWTRSVMADLQLAQRACLSHLEVELRQLKDEHWNAHARLGLYGDSAKERAALIAAETRA